jgi:tetratricopeptide (TPR) repeat protein
MVAEVANIMKRSMSVAGLSLLLTLGSCSMTTPPSEIHEVKVVSNTLNIDVLWNFGKPAESEQRFREAMATGNADEKLELETQIARTYGLRRDYARAHETLDRVAGQITASTSDAVRVRLALERGRTIRVEKDFEAARSNFQDAFDRAVAAQLTILAIDAAHMFGFSKDLDEAMRWNQRAMEIARSTEDPRAIQWRASLANNMGVSERGKKNYNAALSHFQTALDSETRLARASRIFLANWQISNTLRLQGKIDDALAIQTRLETEMLAKNEPDAYVYDELAELYLAKGDHAKAKSYAEKSLMIAEKDEWVLKNEVQRLTRLRQLSK